MTRVVFVVLVAASGRVKVTSEALALAVLFQARVEPRRAVSTADSPVSHDTEPPRPIPFPPPPRGIRHVVGRSPLSLTLLGGLALLAGAGLLALVSRRR